MLRVARSTLSRYCRFFKDYLSEKPQTGRHQRKYTEEDIAVLREISLLTHKVNFADIPKFLTVKKPKDIETEEIGYDIQELLWIVNHEIKELDQSFKAQEETNKKLLFKYDLLVKHLEQTRYLINSSAFIREVSIEKKEIEERITSLESQKRSFISISL
jgi:DNA-binding transcriptional MerR regulator